jgi:hypothetical protein
MPFSRIARTIVVLSGHARVLRRGHRYIVTVRRLACRPTGVSSSAPVSFLEPISSVPALCLVALAPRFNARDGPFPYLQFGNPILRYGGS